jgi:hypothetical protein
LFYGTKSIKLYDFLLLSGYISNKVDNSNEQSWWFLSFFTTQDLTAKGLSVTDTEFYTQLLDSVKEDIECVSDLFISVFSSYFDSTYYLNENTLLYIYLLIAFVSFSLAAIFCYFSKRVRTKNKKTKTIKKPKGTKNKCDDKNKCDVKENEHVKVTSCYGGFHLGCYGSKKYLFGWLTGLMMAAFLLSIPWEFVRLYQSMVAEKVTHISTVSLHLPVYFKLSTEISIAFENQGSSDPVEIFQSWQNAGKYEYFPCRRYLPANTGRLN